MSCESLMITLQSRLLYLAHSSFLFIIYCHLPNKTGCLKRRICMVWKPVSGESEHYFYWSERAAEILSLLPWSAELGQVMWAKRWCWNAGPFHHGSIFYYYSNDIKLTLTNTSHIVPSNRNVETYLAVDVVFLLFFWVLTSQSNLSKIKSVISDHIIGFVHLLSFSILVYSRESLNCSWHLLMAHVH